MGWVTDMKNYETANHTSYDPGQDYKPNYSTNVPGNRPELSQSQRLKIPGNLRGHSLESTVKKLEENQ